MFDKWLEIFSTIRKNKLRTFLTGFAIAWGIFILMVLLGAGNGLSNGVASNFQGSSINSIYLWGKETSMPYQGFKANRRIQLTLGDYDEIKKMDGINNISAIYWIGSRVFSYKNEYGQYDSRAIHPGYPDIENLIITQGRFINDIDMQYDRKVIVIGEDIRKALFKENNPIGEFMKVGDVLFKVIGVYKESDPREGSNQGLIPIATAQRLFNSGNDIHNLVLTTFEMPKETSQELEKDILRTLAIRHQFNPEDTRAIGSYNSLENYIETMNIFKAIKIFIWLIGIGTLIAGIVGVSNIMLISVKERTKEFGIRKALGATPGSIIGLVLMEAVMITLIAGYLGMFMGISLMEGINYIMEQQAQMQAASDDLGSMTMFLNPTVDINIALGAMLLLVAAGTFAGYIPAKRAASIRPIVALHDE